MPRSAEEKMFRVLLMLGADILESVNALKVDAGIIDKDEDLKPLFTPEMLRYAQYAHSVDDLYAMVELVDPSLDVPLHVDPVTARAFDYIHTLNGLIHEREHCVCFLRAGLRLAAAIDPETLGCVRCQTRSNLDLQAQRAVKVTRWFMRRAE